MKKIALVLLCLLLCLSLFACADSAKKDAGETQKAAETTKKLIEKSENEDGSYTLYDYDDNGNCIKATTYDAEGTVQQWSETEYDENGIWVKKTYYDSEGNIVREIVQ